MWYNHLDMSVTYLYYVIAQLELVASEQKSIILRIKLSDSGALQACKETLLPLSLVKLEHFSDNGGDYKYFPNLRVGCIPSGATTSRTSDAVSQN